MESGRPAAAKLSREDVRAVGYACGTVFIRSARPTCRIDDAHRRVRGSLVYDGGGGPSRPACASKIRDCGPARDQVADFGGKGSGARLVPRSSLGTTGASCVPEMRSTTVCEGNTVADRPQRAKQHPSARVLSDPPLSHIGGVLSAGETMAVGSDGTLAAETVCLMPMASMTASTMQRMLNARLMDRS